MAAMPAAVLTRFCSAIPVQRNAGELVEEQRGEAEREVGALRTTMSSSCAAAASSSSQMTLRLGTVLGMAGLLAGGEISDDPGVFLGIGQVVMPRCPALIGAVALHRVEDNSPWAFPWCATPGQRLVDRGDVVAGDGQHVPQRRGPPVSPASSRPRCNPETSAGGCGPRARTGCRARGPPLIAPSHTEPSASSPSPSMCSTPSAACP